MSKDIVKIYMFGVGENADKLESIMKPGIELVKYIDNGLYGTTSEKKGKPIVLPINCEKEGFDYIVISSMSYEFIRQQLVNLGFDRSKIVSFFDIGDVENSKVCNELFDPIIRLEMCLFSYINKCTSGYETKLSLLTRNMAYEIKEQLDDVKDIKVHSIDETLDYILDTHCSVARYGDGEFDIMNMKDSIKFQRPNQDMNKRLQEILNKTGGKFIVCIADNYGSLDYLTSDAAQNIRRILDKDTRTYQCGILNENVIYHNAYVTRLYSILNDNEKAKAKVRFDKWKQVWNNKNVTIIEGHQTRIGVGNDLLDNAKSITRILAPSENAFDRYDEILGEALKTDKDSLVLIALGPTATILAYDLYKEGYWAIDIGHLDIEYEWWRREQGNRSYFRGKYIQELAGGNIVEDIDDPQYQKQIIARCY